jgi:twitching motility protein PilT
VADLKSGIVLVTGPVVSGKSSTLAALVDLINQQHSHHIITVEDPIEFLHNHIRSTIHQREVHSDAPSAGLALRAALRQSPNVIMLGEIRDRESVELLLEAAETGHLVLSTLNTVDASKTVERVVGMFSPAEHSAIRNRLAKVFRYFISQKLIHRADGSGLVPIVEIVKANAHTRECVANGHLEGHSLAEYVRLDAADGMQDFDSEIEKLVRAGIIDADAALAHANNPAQLRRALEKI